MTRITATRALLALVIIVLGNLQAWDSDVPSAGLWIVLLVSLATALPAVALLVPLRQSWFLAVFALSFLLLLIARVASPITLPGLFLVLIPAVMALIYTGMVKESSEDELLHL